MQAPQRREPSGRDGFAEGVRRPAEDDRSLIEVILEQPRFGEQRAEREFVLARQGRGAQRRTEQLRRVGTATPLERRLGAREQRLQG